MNRLASITFVGLLGWLGVRAQSGSELIGEFEGQIDVGQVLHPGSATFDPAGRTYTLTGSGENMWFATDEFHFVWKKMTAEDVSLTANISVLDNAGSNHRKGVLMIRQSLDTDSAYVDVARHADGLTSLQYRDQKGGTTREVESSIDAPARVRIEKHGDRFYMWLAREGNEMEFAGGSARVQIHTPFYVGIGVTAHDKNAVTKVAFENVGLQTSVEHRKARYSTVETVLQSGDARSGFVSTKHLKLPGWTTDGRSLTFEGDDQKRQAAFVPLKTAVPVGAPLNASSEKHVYVSKKQAGRTQIWRKGIGGEAEQLTSDDFNNAEPRLSPDGKLLAFLSYPKETSSLPKKGDVSLRLMTLAGKKIKTLAFFRGGQGSLGKQPWSPDGKRLAYVSYQVIN
jgi:TolB protein